MAKVNNQAPKDKKAKKKGPVRIEAVAPLTFLVVAFGIYFNYFFDGHLRWLLEFGGTQANGAEVNVGYLDMRWTEPGIVIGNIQVTNKEQPTHNLLEVGKIRMRLLWDGLLRGKVVVPESSILDIKVGTQRRRPGRVLPPKPPSTGDSQAVLIAKAAADKTITQLKAQNETNFLSDIMAVAGGTDYRDQLKNMENQLKSAQLAKQLESELKIKEQEWKQRIDELPDESELKQLTAKVEKFKFDSSNPAAVQKSIQELDGIYKEASAKYKTVEGAKKALTEDFNKYKGTSSSLEKMIKEDIDGLAAKLNLPSLDPQEITKMLLGNMVADQLGQFEKYKDMARDYMPTKKSNEKTAELTPIERAKGRDFKFYKSKSYPMFWLQKASISSKASEGGFSGDITGTITDLTESPRHLGRPTRIMLSGDFPHSEIFGVNAEVTIDHTTDNPKETAKIQVAKFPMTKNTLTKSSDFAFGYNKALGQSQMDVTYEQSTLSIQVKTLFQQVDYFVEAKEKKIKEILTNVTGQLNNIDLNIRAKGSWEDLSLHINSNLGQKIADAIKGEIQAQILKARQQVEQHVRGLIGKEKEKIEGELAKLEQQLGISLKSKDEAIKSAQAAVDNKKKELENSKKAELKAKATKEIKKIESKLSDKDKDKLDKLKKKFKF